MGEIAHDVMALASVGDAQSNLWAPCGDVMCCAIREEARTDYAPLPDTCLRLNRTGPPSEELGESKGQGRIDQVAIFNLRHLHADVNLKSLQRRAAKTRPGHAVCARRAPK